MSHSMCKCFDPMLSCTDRTSCHDEWPVSEVGERHKVEMTQRLTRALITSFAEPVGTMHSSHNSTLTLDILFMRDCDIAYARVLGLVYACECSWRSLLIRESNRLWPRYESLTSPSCCYSRLVPAPDRWQSRGQWRSSHWRGRTTPHGKSNAEWRSWRTSLVPRPSRRKEGLVSTACACAVTPSFLGAWISL